MENPDDLWPPFGPQSARRADRAHRLLHERAQRAHDERRAEPARAERDPGRRATNGW